MKITNEMVREALAAYQNGWHASNADMSRCIRAALTAALATQPDREAENARLTAEVARLLAILEDVVMAHDLPGDHHEMEQVVQRIRAALEATDDTQARGVG